MPKIPAIGERAWGFAAGFPWSRWEYIGPSKGGHDIARVGRTEPAETIGLSLLVSLLWDSEMSLVANSRS